MSSKADLFLKKNLGEDFFESLSKVELWKQGTRTTIDHEEMKTALQIVPRTVMAMLIRELAPMATGEHKEIHLFFGANAMLKIEKHERDVYSGEILEENKKVAEFKMRSLPGVGLVILSAFELYDMDSLSGHQHKEMNEDADAKVQKLIDERLALHSLVERVVEQKLTQRDAVHQMMLMKLTEELEHHRKQNAKIAELKQIHQNATPQSDPYFRGMTNGIEVVNSVVNKKEPEFVEAPKKGSPLKGFLEQRKKKAPKEFVIEMAKGENVDCPDCGKNIFDGKLFSGCICLGDDREKKVFIKKTEEGIKVRFSRGWDIENIEMLLEVLRRKHG